MIDLSRKILYTRPVVGVGAGPIIKNLLSHPQPPVGGGPPARLMMCLMLDDFLIFENSKRYNLDEFIEFVMGFDIIESERKFKNLSIDTDSNSAHITLDHHGEFLINTPNGKQRLIFDWLESAYLIKDGKSLKFKFYFSEAIKDTIISL